MIELKKEELDIIIGGAFSGTLINAFVRGINALLDLGRSLGSAIRRIQNGTICRL